MARSADYFTDIPYANGRISSGHDPDVRRPSPTDLMVMRADPLRKASGLLDARRRGDAVIGYGRYATPAFEGAN